VQFAPLHTKFLYKLVRKRKVWDGEREIELKQKVHYEPCSTKLCTCFYYLKEVFEILSFLKLSDHHVRVHAAMWTLLTKTRLTGKMTGEMIGEMTMC